MLIDIYNIYYNIGVKVNITVSKYKAKLSRYYTIELALLIVLYNPLNNILINIIISSAYKYIIETLNS